MTRCKYRRFVLFVLSVFFGVVPAQLIIQVVWLVDLGCTLSTRAEAGGMLSLLRVVSFFLSSFLSLRFFFPVWVTIVPIIGVVAG